MDDAGDGIDRSFAGNHPKVTSAADGRRHFVATFGAQGQFFTISTGKQTMSVAFRREGDDEHKEPEFELPIAVGPNWVTPRGLRLLGEAVAQIEAEIAGTTDAEARKKLQRRLRYFHTRQSTAEVQAPPADGGIGVGSRVTYRLNKAEKRITIVGGDEAEPTLGSIAFSAPLARALMGAEAGESVEYQDREDAIAILAVETDPETQA
jgi:transcription elongation GreA/GreB family factor